MHFLRNGVVSGSEGAEVWLFAYSLCERVRIVCPHMYSMYLHTYVPVHPCIPPTYDNPKPHPHNCNHHTISPPVPTTSSLQYGQRGRGKMVECLLWERATRGAVYMRAWTTAY